MKKCTIDEALDQLVSFPASRELGHNVRVLGTRERYLRFSLYARHEQGTYNELHVDLYINEKKRTSYAFVLTEKRFEPSNPEEKSNPGLENGGFFSGYGTTGWFNWQPDLEKVRHEIEKITQLHAISYGIA